MVKAQPILSVHEIGISMLGRKILDNISFDIMEGERVAIFGPHKSGKTPLLLIMAGIMEHSKGRVILKCRGHLKNRGKIRLSSAIGIGAVDRIKPIIEDFTVYENLYFYARSLRMKEPEKAALETARAFELFDIMKTRAGSIKPLNSALLGAALAFLNSPGITMLDEPTRRLTGAEEKEFWKILDRNLSQKTLIFSTIKEREVKRNSGRAIKIARGILK